MASELSAICNPGVRHEFVYLFEVINSNPNGDPDALNAPRTIPDTGHGLVSDTSIKRKIRDYLSMVEDVPIFIQSDIALNEKKQQAAERVMPPLDKKERGGKSEIPRLRDQLCRDYYDIRMFGAVLATGAADDRLNAGKVTGPVQINFATSLDPISIKFNAGSRKAKTTNERLEEGETEFGISTPIVPYAVYRTHGFFSPFLAEQTGVDENDLRLLWEALKGAFATSRSRSRPEINVRGLSVFTHDSKLGRAPAHKLFDRVHAQRRPEVSAAQKFSDYEVIIDESTLPGGVSLTHVVDPRD